MNEVSVLPIFSTDTQAIFEYTLRSSQQSKINLFCYNIYRFEQGDTQTFLVKILVIFIFKLIELGNNTKNAGYVYTSNVSEDLFMKFSSTYDYPILRVTGKKSIPVIESLFNEINNIDQRTNIYFLENPDKHVTSFRIFTSDKYNGETKHNRINPKHLDQIEMYRQKTDNKLILTVKIIKHKLFSDKSICILTNKNFIEKDVLNEPNENTAENEYSKNLQPILDAQSDHSDLNPILGKKYQSDESMLESIPKEQQVSSSIGNNTDPFKYLETTSDPIINTNVLNNSNENNEETNKDQKTSKENSQPPLSTSTIHWYIGIPTAILLLLLLLTYRLKKKVKVEQKNAKVSIIRLEDINQL